MPSEDYIYPFIPNLRDLLKKSAGLPGVEYAIVAVSNIKHAQNNGWRRLHGNQAVFTIEGPAGRIDCELYGKGEPIRGQDPSSGRRVLMVDKAVRQDTGLGVELEEVPPKVLAAQPTVAPKASSSSAMQKRLDKREAAKAEAQARATTNG